MSHLIKQLLISVAIAFGLCVPAAAQGVFDMGALTNSISTSANTQAEQKRAAPLPNPLPQGERELTCPTNSLSSTIFMACCIPPITGGPMRSS
jgi:hypothetical protein